VALRKPGHHRASRWVLSDTFRVGAATRPRVVALALWLATRDRNGPVGRSDSEKVTIGRP